MKATHIVWKTPDPSLPTEMEVPDRFKTLDQIANYIVSNNNGRLVDFKIEGPPDKIVPGQTLYLEYVHDDYPGWHTITKTTTVTKIGNKYVTARDNRRPYEFTFDRNLKIFYDKKRADGYLIFLTKEEMHDPTEREKKLKALYEHVCGIISDKIKNQQEKGSRFTVQALFKIDETINEDIRWQKRQRMREQIAERKEKEQGA